MNKKWEEWRKSDPRDPVLIERYRKRRMTGIFGGFLPALAALLLMGFGLGSECDSVWGMTEYVFATFGMIVVLVGIPLFFFCYRCPTCGRLPMKTGARGVEFAPDICPHCDTILS